VRRQNFLWRGALSIRTVKIELAGENGMYFIFPVKHINDVVKKQLSSCTF
jgi:hypothetical protein